MSTSEWIKLITIPFFTGVIGWLINWTALIMLFNPMRFHGWKIPGLYELSRLFPRKLQEDTLEGGSRAVAERYVSLIEEALD